MPRGRREEEACPPPHEDRRDWECGDRREERRPEDSTEFMVRTWQSAFERAAHEVQVEILKERIRKAWGNSLNSIADSVIELMMTDWEATQGREKAEERKEKAWEALVEKIAAAYNKGPK
ncbi:MAG: hypothetical protein WC728_00160 [Elusimicrobiota bacterium]